MARLILCVPTERAAAYKVETGYHDHCWLDRDDAEKNPKFRQVIPYIVVHNPITGQILSYVRSGNEDRLIGRLSIGFGGHVDFPETVEDALARELREEIGINVEDANLSAPAGVIVSGQSEVNSVHMGVVYMAESEVFALSEEVKEADWKSPGELGDYFEQLESWSQIALMAISNLSVPSLEGSLIRYENIRSEACT